MTDPKGCEPSQGYAILEGESPCHIKNSPIISVECTEQKKENLTIHSEVQIREARLITNCWASPLAECIRSIAYAKKGARLPVVALIGEASKNIFF